MEQAIFLKTVICWGFNHIFLESVGQCRFFVVLELRPFSVKCGSNTKNERFRSRKGGPHARVSNCFVDEVGAMHNMTCPDLERVGPHDAKSTV